ncbi:TBPIP-domain-containing protein [Obba rivulosa]|uniref:TBPIP-domain-containing protein n=1 Tax=Obba rivulosa TaxID=1052685 RepID=A0A8E2AR68_9APHY|nr:TBPIP-domain-containing protein [Obba rivulosa]
MSAKPKTTEPKLPVLKGQDAEDAVLEYLKRMNRPFGAVDVSANLKGAVPKTATQKILVALADKGEIVQKTYGKTTFFVANQANLEDMPAEKLAALEAEHKALEEENKALAAEVRTATTELAKLRNTPTDAELSVELQRTIGAVEKARARLQPLRSGAPLVTADELTQLDTEWARWRTEWVRRRKIFLTFWQMVTDALTPQEADELAEELGIEHDTLEHVAIERGPLCVPAGVQVLGKRRR